MQQIQHKTKRGRRSTIRPDVYLEGVAKQIGICSAHLSKILRGISNPSMHVAGRLAGALGISIDELMRDLGKARRDREKQQARHRAA